MQPNHFIWKILLFSSKFQDRLLSCSPVLITSSSPILCSISKILIFVQFRFHQHSAIFFNHYHNQTVRRLGFYHVLTPHLHCVLHIRIDLFVEALFEKIRNMFLIHLLILKPEMFLVLKCSCFSTSLKRWTWRSAPPCQSFILIQPHQLIFD